MIEHKNLIESHWAEISNPSYRIGPYTFNLNGAVRINGVEYYEDSIDLRKVFAEAREKQEMWRTLNDE